MTPPDLDEFLQRHKRVGLDTSLFIYFVEANSRYQSAVHSIFHRLEAGGFEGVTSTLTMLEVLVQPYRTGDSERAVSYPALLIRYPNLLWAPTNLSIADRAAQLRARFLLKTPDAIQAATAIEAGATGFLCNDSAFARVPGLDVLLLDRLLVDEL